MCALVRKYTASKSNEPNNWEAAKTETASIESIAFFVTVGHFLKLKSQITALKHTFKRKFSARSCVSRFKKQTMGCSVVDHCFN